MAWFKFTKDFPHRPIPSSVIDYKQGMHLNIPAAHVEAALAAGAGEVSKHKPKAGDKKDGSQEERTEDEQSPADNSQGGQDE